MSYIAIARKWRPKNFAEISGQQHVTRTLENAILQDRVHHAYLFSIFELRSLFFNDFKELLIFIILSLATSYSPMP